MACYPREDFRLLARYLPDRSPVAADLSDNRNLWGAHPAAVKVLAAFGASGLAEYPEAYGDRLAEAVSAKLRVPGNCVATGVGGTGVLDALMRAVAPTTFRFLEPVWPAATMLARMNGHQPVPTAWESGLAEPARLVGDTPCIVFLANPANPTGLALPDPWIRAVQQLTEKVGSVLIIDEAYGEYGRGVDDRTPIDLALKGERTFCAKTLSKAYGLAGMRVGYGVGSPALVLEVDKARGPFALSGVASAAGAAAVSSDSLWLSRTLAEARENRSRLTDSLRRRGFSVPTSAANFVFIELPAAKLEPTARGLERCGVRVRPFRGLASGTGLRATVGPWDPMRQLLGGLDRVGAGRS